MDRFVIQGGRKLSGSLRVMGAKNAATPIIAATVLIQSECVLSNVPRIADVERMLDNLKQMGAEVEWSENHTVRISCESLDGSKIDYRSVAQMRSSVFFLSCLAQRFGVVRMPVPGGCNIGSRPLDAHIEGLRDLGFSVKVESDVVSVERVGSPSEEIVLQEMSVTATENIILASVIGSGTTRIFCAASEPHVQDLCWFLTSAGADIEGIGTHSLSIRGVARLHGADHSVIPDQIETGSFIALAAATHSPIEIENCAPEFMRFELRKFRETGVSYSIIPNGKDFKGKYELATIRMKKKQTLNAIKRLQDMPYPGFPADLVQPFALLMTQSQGISLIHDWMYDGRQRYVGELQKMGANITILDPHRILVVGPTPLYGKDIVSYDLRAGATLVMAGLIAEGQTTIAGVDQIDRGYERLDERLRTLGASIDRV